MSPVEGTGHILERTECALRMAAILAEKNGIASVFCTILNLFRPREAIRGLRLQFRARLGIRDAELFVVVSWVASEKQATRVAALQFH